MQVLVSDKIIVIALTYWYDLIIKNQIQLNMMMGVGTNVFLNRVVLAEGSCLMGIIDSMNWEDDSSL